MSSEQDLITLIQLHLTPSSFHNEETIGVAAHLFSLFEDDYIKKIKHETFYVLPYKQISICVYESDLDDIPSNTLNGFATTVSYILGSSGMCNDTEHVIKCYEKFIEHISLAFAQKSFMQKVGNNALEMAKKANQLALESEKNVNHVLNISAQAQTALSQAQSTANKAEEAAKHAQQLANEADAQAKSTIANYISILGIFASIIFTLFGGVNLIGSTVKLLETSSRLPYLVFIVSLLMICLLTLLNMMVKWVNSMSNLKNILENQKNATNPNPQPSHFCWKVWQGDFYTKAVSIFLIMALLSLIGMYCIKKEHFFSFTEEVTSEVVKEPKGIISALDKPASEAESATEKPKGDVTSNTTDNDENDNKDVKVVKTFTFSNHPNSDKDEKEDK